MTLVASPPATVSRPVWMIILALMLVFAGYAFAKPKYAWDSTQYVGCILSTLEGGSWEEKRARTYDYLAQHYPPDVFAHLTTSPPGISPYRSIVATDPEGFRQTQPAYCYKIGFVGPAIALVWAGVDPHWALRILSVVPAVLLFGLVTLWLCRRIDPRVAIPVAVMGAGAMLLQTARYEYPDSLTALCIAAALLCYADGRGRAPRLLFLASMVVRADAIIYFGAFLAYATFVSATPRRYAFWRVSVPWGLAALALYFAIVTVMQPPPYRSFFNHCFNYQTAYLMTSPETVSLAFWWDVLSSHIWPVISEGPKLPGMILLAVIGFAWSRRDDTLRALGDIGVVSFLMVALHFTLFPYYDPRYYAAPYMMMIVGGGSVVALRVLSLRNTQGA